jgi:hypothetical protein
MTWRGESERHVLSAKGIPNMIRLHIQKRKQNDLEKVKALNKASNWNELRTNLQKFNMESDEEFSQEFLHIHWTTLHAILLKSKHSDSIKLFWKTTKYKMQMHNIDNIKPNECLQIRWKDLNRIIGD